MTRRQVRDLALAWLKKRPQHLVVVTEHLSASELEHLQRDKKETGATASEWVRGLLDGERLP